MGSTPSRGVLWIHIFCATDPASSGPIGRSVDAKYSHNELLGIEAESYRAERVMLREVSTAGQGSRAMIMARHVCMNYGRSRSRSRYRYHRRAPLLVRVSGVCVLYPMLSDRSAQSQTRWSMLCKWSLETGEIRYLRR